MSHWLRPIAFIVACLVSGVAGCVPSMTLDEISAMRPARAGELDALDVLAGDWETKGIAHFAGLDDVLQVSGRSSARWADDDRTHLVERSTTEIPGLNTLSGTMIWTWDPRARTFRIFRVDGYPVTGVGTARFDQANATWKLRVDARLPQLDAVARGSIEVIDKDTLKWNWQEWDALGFVEIVNMKGFSRRVGPRPGETTPSSRSLRDATTPIATERDAADQSRNR